MKDSSRRSFVKTSAATGLTFTFAGLIRAHGQSGGGNTTWNPEGTFFSTNSGETTTYDPNGTYVTTDPGVTTSWDPDATTMPETTEQSTTQGPINKAKYVHSRNGNFKTETFNLEGREYMIKLTYRVSQLTTDWWNLNNYKTRFQAQLTIKNLSDNDQNYTGVVAPTGPTGPAQSVVREFHPACKESDGSLSCNNMVHDIHANPAINSRQDRTFLINNTNYVLRVDLVPGAGDSGPRYIITHDKGYAYLFRKNSDGTLEDTPVVTVSLDQGVEPNACTVKFISKEQ